MNGRYILDEHGEAVACDDLIQWARWYETADRALAKTEIGESKVSTVFLGVDHSFNEEGPPMLWETMVFGGALDDQMGRYPTREQAVAGHEAMCESVRLAKTTP